MTDAMTDYLLLGFVLFFGLVALFQYLWNTTMPEVFGLRVIGFWQAFRLLLLSALLTGGAFVHFNVGH